MKNRLQQILRKRIWIPITLILLISGGYWLLPIHGQVVLSSEKTMDQNIVWPLVRVEPDRPVPGQMGKIIVIDNIPWAGIQSMVNGRNTKFEQVEVLEDDTPKTWRWTWSYIVPQAPSYEVVIYRDCQTGCLERARMVIGQSVTSSSLVGPPETRTSTKLGLVFANPDRDWHNRSGWVVDLTYARLPDARYWGINDLAERVHADAAKSLRVLVRVDYDQGQGLPPADDYTALDLYLKYLRQLARDQRLKDVYGFIIGSDVNALDSNVLSPDQPVTPEWYARVFNGYGSNPAFTDNAVEVIRAENPGVRVLVGSLRPWSTDQNGGRRYIINEPWLNYMNSLVANLNATAMNETSLGIPATVPDGFAITAAGRIDIPELTGTDVGSDWNESQVGFHVYKYWLKIINSYRYTKDLPVFIIATNTFSPETGTPPLQNYPRGWLTSALNVVNHEPQIQSLCWFMDYFPYDEQWEMFSLTNPSGRLVDAADEFDQLLKQKP